MKRILMVAYHFPPVQGSSGVHRTLQFVRYLPRYGWQPAVLVPHHKAYQNVRFDQNTDIPANVVVRRSFALDTARHLSVNGRYLRITALPDRWASWVLGAVPAGLRLIRQFQPDILWSTYPIATSHLIGYILKKISGLPWVADFRDPLGQQGYPADPLTRRSYWALEKRIVKNAETCVFTTPGTRNLYAGRYPEKPSEKLKIIENGYDESSFSDAEKLTTNAGTDKPSLSLVHSGLLYPSERNPIPFFDALENLKKKGTLVSGQLRIVLRATGHDTLYRAELQNRQIQDIVSLKPSIPYRQALAELMSVSGLLLFQGASCNNQIPAKAYEYLRAGRPVLALTDQKGDTAGMLQQSGAAVVFAPMNDAAAIESKLVRFLEIVRSGDSPKIDTARFSRLERTLELSKILNHIMSGSND